MTLPSDPEVGAGGGWLSEVQRLDTAVYLAIKQYAQNPDAFKGNVDSVFDAANGGVGYAPLSKKVSAKDRAYITKKTNAILKLIATGKIVPPTK